MCLKIVVLNLLLASNTNSYSNKNSFTRILSRRKYNGQILIHLHHDVSSDTYYNSVSLLLPMNGGNGSTTFTDYSSAGYTVTNPGITNTVSIDTSFINLMEVVVILIIVHLGFPSNASVQR